MKGFVADVHLGKLARLLRLLGIDTLYSNNYTNEILPRIASGEGRVLLSRNPAFARLAQLDVLIIKSEVSEEQLLEVDKEFGIIGAALPFSRCLTCNGELHEVAKTTVQSQLPANSALYYHAFWRCSHCQKIYWKGAHHSRMLARLKKLGIE
jgi:uncharacterized protein